ncbi:hypothetical protein [Streptomyces sp. DT195]
MAILETKPADQHSCCGFWVAAAGVELRALYLGSVTSGSPGPAD